MAKRFTDTDKWKKPFIRSLKGAYKLLWLYIIDDCDHAGIWQVDIDVAELRLGEEINPEEALQNFAGHVIPFSNGEKWFIPDFVDFQYGVLNPDNRAHNSVISLLKKYNLIDEENKVLTSPLKGAKDKEKDKEKDKVKRGVGKNENSEDYYRIIKHLKITNPEVEKLFNSGYSKELVDSVLDSIENYKLNTKYTSLFLTAKKWLAKETLLNSEGKSNFSNILERGNSIQFNEDNFKGL